MHLFTIALSYLRRLLFVLFPIVIHLNIFAADYYISNTGNDSNNGQSASTPFQTIAKINSVSLQPGDRVLFEAGSTWRETLEINANGSRGSYIVYTRYGTGRNPCILGSDLATDWTHETGNIWRSGTVLENFSEEYYAGRIFFIDTADSVSWGHYKGTSTAELTSEFDYVVNGSHYYVYSPYNPGTYYKSVEATQRQWCISIGSMDYLAYIEVNGIDFMFSRMAGFYSGYPEDYRATDLVIRNCRIGYIGAQPSGFAYGIEAWHSNFLVENCYITDCGRRGISFNLYLASRSEPCSISNVIIRNNIFKRGYHTTSLDMSSQQTSIDTISNVYYYHNIVDDSEFSEICEGCYSNQVFFQNGDGNNLLDSIYVVGNLFINATARNILFEGTKTTFVWNNTIVGHNPNITEHPYNNVVWNSDDAKAYYRNNILFDNLPDNDIQNHGVFIYYTYEGDFIEKDYNLYYSRFPKNDRNFSAHKVDNEGGMGYWNTNDWNDYLSENELFEHHSPSPSDPLFIDYSKKDFRVADTSPAIGAGNPTPWVIVTDPFGVLDTINKYDLARLPFNPLSWDVGAYSRASLNGLKPLTIAYERVFTLYPNPTSQYCIVKPDALQNGTYCFTIYDPSGKMVFESARYTPSEPAYITLENFAAGLYFIRLYNDNAYMESKKLMIIK